MNVYMYAYIYRYMHKHACVHMCLYIYAYMCVCKWKSPVRICLCCIQSFTQHRQYHESCIYVYNTAQNLALFLSLFLSRSLLLSLFLSRLSSLVLFSLRPVLLKAVCTDVSHHFFSAPLLASCSKALFWKQCEQVRWSPPSNYWPGGFPPGEKTRTNITFVICIDRAML